MNLELLNQDYPFSNQFVSFCLFNYLRFLTPNVENYRMKSDKQIILISETSKLKINFEHMLNVENQKIALLGFQSPDITAESTERSRNKRVPKDSYFVGDTLSMVVHCDQIKDNFFVNNVYSSNSSLSLKCLSILQIKSGLGYNSIDIQNPSYHNLNTSSLLSLEIELRDLRGELLEFDRGYIVVKLGLK